MNINWKVTDDYFSLEFDYQVRALSSAILNGGYAFIKSFINMRVGENFGGKQTVFPPPQQTIADAAASAGLPKPFSGMMTAASMNSFRYAAGKIEGIEVYCFLTAGLSNALAAGDRGVFLPRQIYSDNRTSPFGTINIAVGTNIELADAALAEALMIVTEAKSSVLFELGVKSTESKRAATGTGTDSAVVFCDTETSLHPPEAFCGKHTVIGEALASVVRTALFGSLKEDRFFR